MNMMVFGLAPLIAVASFPDVNDHPQVRGFQPRLLVASGIDDDENLIVSGTEQRQKKIRQEVVNKDGKKITRDVTASYPVTVLGRKMVSLRDVTIYDGESHIISVAQARDRIKGPTPILVTMLGEGLDSVYLKMVTKETLIFTFGAFPVFKDVPSSHSESGFQNRKATVMVGKKVPDFAVRALDGTTLKLSDLQKEEERPKSKPVVLTFWCSTCGSCRRIEHALDKLAKDYKGQAVVVALDANAGETAERVAGFAKRQGLTMPIVLDGSGRTADMFGVDVTTTTVVIDRTGMLRYCGRFRDDDQNRAEEALKAVLAGKEVAVKTTPPEG
jgi:thiol-disulfide isomerase/thioredoxin